MSELSKQALLVDNNQSFPNNNNGAITPSILRAFNTNMIDSLVDELGYNVDSASWNQQIDALETFSGSTSASISNLNASSASQQISINNLNVFTASASGLSTGSLLVTASAASNVITFTKGDASTFNVTVADTTDLSSLNQFTASAAISITNLNASSASQQISINSLNSATASYVTETESGSFLLTASFDNGTRNLTFTKGNNTTFNVNIPDVSGSAGDFVTTSSFNSYTASNDQKVNSLISATGSYATTGSNTFIGNQIINGGLIVSSSSPIGFSGSSFIVDTFNGGGAITFRPGTSINFFGNTNFTSPIRTTIVNVDNSGSNGYYGFNAETEGRIYQDFSGSVNARINAAAVSGGAAISVQDEGSILGTVSSFNFNGAGVTATVSAGTASITIPGGGGTIDTGSFATTGSNSFNGDQTITGSVRAGTFIVGTIAQAPTIQSLDSGTPAGNTSLQVNAGASGSFSLRTLYGAGVGKAILEAYDTYPSYNTGGKIEALSQGGLNLTGYAGNIQSTAPQISVVNDNGFVVARQGNLQGGVYMNTTSGSLILTPSGFSATSSSLLHLSASSNTNFVNLLFKNNNTAADTIISGSANMFINPAAPTAGFKRYVGGSGNIALNGSNVPQISSSMAFSPTMNNNYFGGNSTTLTMRGPVSSSTYTISANVIQGTVNIGSSATNNAEKAVAGLTMTGNSINGALTFIANRSLHTQTNQISNNAIVGGTTTLTAASSSIIYSNNIGGNISVTNNTSGGLTSNSANSIQVTRNLFVGAANTITASGSQDPGDTSGTSYLRHIEDNQILGTLNGVNLPYAPTGSNSLNATMIAGYGLGVTGSNASGFVPGFEYGGSAFFGRYNAQNGNRAQSAQTVFAVGTGTSSTRKTGFLIDSGSNTFIEGTLNVSGSTSFTGSLTISGSIITVDRSGNEGNTYLGLNALGMGSAGVQPLAFGNTVSIAIGQGAMRYASGSQQNVAIGIDALKITSGSNNFALGSYSLESNTTGGENVALGTGALNKNISGQRNIALGSGALFGSTAGDFNIGIGYGAGNTLSGSTNVFLGYRSGENFSGSKNVLIGGYQGVGETLNNNIILSDGEGNIKAQYSGSIWSMKAPVNFTTGSNQQAGTAVLDGANPGTITVSNSLVTANSIIMVSKQTLNHTNGYVAVSAKSAGSFTITSNHNGDTDTVGWFIINNS